MLCLALTEFRCTVHSPQRTRGILTLHKLSAAELSRTHEVQPPNNKPPGCAVINKKNKKKNLGVAIDTADLSQRTSVWRKTMGCWTERCHHPDVYSARANNKSYFSISHKSFFWVAGGVCFKNCEDGTEKWTRCFIVFPAPGGPPRKLIKLSIIKCPLAEDGIYAVV